MWRCWVGCTPRVAAGAVGLGCFADRRCSAAAWRTDHSAVRVPRPTPLGLAGRKGRDRPLEPAAPAGRIWACEWDASPHGVVMAPRSGISGDGSDAATCRGVEEMRLQWTMSSSVDDVLPEGSTFRTDMRLNDFL
ncbi:retrotransposon hot spot protein (RHS), putative, partial [Trypanosoma cruzi]